MGKKGVESMIEEIKVYIENCKPMRLSQTKISVQKPELLSMLDELELKLPGEIERCKKIMRNKEMILADARTRSDAIITESVNEANRMIEQNEITRLANIRADEILENARNQAQQIVDQASEEANEIRLGAMYYTKDKLTEMRDIFQKIHDMEKENYRVLIESLENDTYVIETNMTEMDTNINMFTASSNMSYEETDDLDSAFSNEPAPAPAPAPQPAPSYQEEAAEDEEEPEEDDDDIDVYIARDQLNKLKKATEEDDRYRITVVWDWYVPCKQIRFRLSDVDNPCFVDLFTLDWVQGNPKTAWEFGQEQRREFTNSIRMQFKDTDWSQILYIDDSNPLVPKLEQMLNERIEELGTHITVLSDQEHATALVRGPENIDEGHSSGPYPIDEWLPLDYLRFRNMSVPVPNMWRQYLHRLYGDYMGIPHDISSHEHVANDYINSAQSKAAMNRFLGRL